MNFDPLVVPSINNSLSSGVKKNKGINCPQLIESSEDLWVYLYFPYFSIEVLTGNVVDKQPCVSVTKVKKIIKVEAANPQAQVLGIKSGMSLQSFYMNERVKILKRNQEVEYFVLESLCEWALKFTPRISKVGYQGLLLEVKGSLKLFGGIKSLMKQMVTELKSLGYKPEFAVTPIPSAAVILCKDKSNLVVVDKTNLKKILSALSSGRLDEERRLAYVALTRARQRAVITYPTTERIAHIGPGGRRKKVSSQASPSRFLHELMPSKKANRRGKKGDSISWSDDYGIKYSVAGKNLPEHFVKSYQVPEGYRPEREPLENLPSSSDNGNTALATDASAVLATDSKPVTSVDISELDSSALEAEVETDADTQEGGKHLLSLIEHALVEMSELRVKGACKLYTKTFKEMLRDFGISRGSALVFLDKKRSGSTSIRELIDASDAEVTSKALSKCTAKELGHFLAYLILSVDTVEE